MSKLIQVFVIGATIRFIIPVLVPGIVDVLSGSVVLSTPMDSFQSLKEGFYYLEHGMGLYDGGVVHHPPLLVILLQLINSLGADTAQILFHALWTVMDLLIVVRLTALNKWYNEHSSQRHGRKFQGLNDDLIASFYLFNPLIVLTNLSHSTLTFVLLCFIESLHQLLVKRSIGRSALALAGASYLSIRSTLLVIPMTALAQVASSINRGAISYLTNFAVAFGGLLFASYWSISSWSFLRHCYGTVLLFEKISPNLGLWWYIFTEMFEFFTPFYVGLFNVYALVFIVPITLRLYEGFIQDEEKKESRVPYGDSFLAVILTYIWLSFTKSYPTVGDLAFGLSLLPIFTATILPHCKYAYVTGLALLVSLLLSPIFYYCWIVLGNGNSNFFYSISLSWGAVHIAILMDLIWAQLTFDYFEENKILEEQRSTLRLTQV